MNTLLQMALATSLFVMAQYVQAHPVDDVDNMTAAQIEMLTQDCLSDYVLDWHDKRCDFLRPEGDADNSYNYDTDEYDEHELVAKVIIVYDPVEGDAKPIVIIGDD